MAVYVLGFRLRYSQTSPVGELNLACRKPGHRTELPWLQADAQLQTILQTLPASERRNEHYNVLGGALCAQPGTRSSWRDGAGGQG